ncbi:MFS transporter [Streptosporangium sp. CA-135522]|uniref:MFS transporter n=1 Tax=Streptosporangium sp. CA-135522 TaxID=3240072 RepID=UPI003D8A6578
MTTVSAPPVASPAPPAPHRATLPIILSGVFMSSLDFFIVNVAIPSMERDLTAGAAAIQWIVAGYGIASGIALITAGRLGDLYGRRRLFIIGMALFTLASAVCGLAPDAGVLVAARVVQGLAAALMSPQVLAILRSSYAGAAQARAFSTYALTMGLAAVFGQLVGGVLIQADLFGLGWRACFLINIPIGAVALALAPRLVPESRGPGTSRLDTGGVILLTLALVALVLPLVQGREQGWPLWIWPSFAISAALFGTFAAHQRRRGVSALVDLELFRERAFTAGLLAQLAFWMGQASFFLVFALYVQRGRGLDALQAGLIFMAIGAGYLATSLTAHHLARRLGRQVIALGALIMAVGLGLLLATAASIGTSGHMGWLIPALIVDGAGMGMAVAPLATTVLARVTPAHAGAASGVLSTAQQIGNSLGVALIGIVFYAAAESAGFLGAFERSLPYLIGVELLLALLVQLLPRRSHQ